MEIEEQISLVLQRVFNNKGITFDKSRFAGGLTNYNYIMEIDRVEYVVRQPGKMTDQMINRNHEAVNNRIASDLGINSKTIFFDPETGIKISEYIPLSRNLAQVNPNAPESIRAVTQLLRKTHGSTTPFPNYFSWKEELEKYETIIREQKGIPFFDYPELRRRLFSFFDTHIIDYQQKPCHNDTVPENFLITLHGEAFLIDWEYAGTNDPAWDLAVYIAESFLDGESSRLFVREYFQTNQPPENELLKIKAFMMAQDLLWSMWALIRHYSGDDFLDYCTLRYNRFSKNLDALEKSLDYPFANMTATAL